jgi:hypothetical protein
MEFLVNPDELKQGDRAVVELRAAAGPSLR